MRQAIWPKCLEAVLLQLFIAAAMAWPPPAAAQGSVGLNIKILSPTEGVEFKKYTDVLSALIKQNWFAVMPEQAVMGNLKGTVTLIFRVQRDGTILIDEPRIETSSKDEKLDKAALEAVRKSVPFDSLPAAFHGSSIELRCEFVYNSNPPQRPPRRPTTPLPQALLEHAVGAARPSAMAG